MPNDGAPPTDDFSETSRDRWRDFGRNAARRGIDLKTVLTNNPKMDRYIREGYEQVTARQDERDTAKKAKVKPSKPVRRGDPFGYDLFGRKLPKAVRGRRWAVRGRR